MKIARTLSLGAIAKLSFVAILFVSCTSGQLSPENFAPRTFVSPRVSFDLPEAETWALENGIQVYYYHNDELPLIQGEMYFRGGSLYDQSGITGLATATGSQMRAGSIRGISPSALDQKLNDLAAGISSSFGDEFGSVSFYSLSEDFGEVFNLFAQVVQKPAFSSQRLSLYKALSLEAISRRRESPSTISAMAFKQLVFGKDSAFAKFSSKQSLSKINRSSLKAFHSRFVVPENAYLAISGSLSKEVVKEEIEKRFGSWSAKAAPLPPLPEISHSIKPGVYVLERDFEQASVVLGHLGPERQSKDAYEISIFNRVFGHGGFSSRLFRKIRTKLGLAYSVYGGVWADVVAGTFQVKMGTRAEQSSRAVKAVIAEIEEMQSGLVSKEDFLAAQSATEKSFVFKFADPNFVAERAVLLELLGYSDGYDEKYLANIASVDREGVLKVAKSRMHTESLVIVIVGKVSAEEIVKDFADSMNVYRLSFDTEPHVVEKLN